MTRRSILRRLLSPVVELRVEEARSVVMMFVYSFLVMSAYNIIKITATSKFIKDLGAENLPWVNLAAGVLMGVVMQLYSRGVGLVPRRWVFPGTQILVIATLALFWLLFRADNAVVSVAFYFWGRLLLGIFLISQFWTLANDIYDPRQAKRVFGFVGGGASLGGLTGAQLTALLAEGVGTENLVIPSMAMLAACFVLVVAILRSTARDAPRGGAPVEEETMGGGEALRLLRSSKHLQLIALVIGFAALGAVFIEQQLNMAVDQLIDDPDARTRYLALVTFYLSGISFFIQVWLTSRIHRLLGIGFALLALPVSLGASATLILLSPALWTSSVARVLDSSLRYSLDKTTREVLFLPLPAELKLKAKPFVDVAVDRFIGKGVGSVLVLILLNLFGFSWYQLSFFSLALCLAWMWVARLARSEYVAVFRRSLERREMEPSSITLREPDLSTVESLVEELGSLDDSRVTYAIDVLEALDKPKLISPLLLHHGSPHVRERALQSFRAAPPEMAPRLLPAIERLLRDPSPEVRAAAVGALSSLRKAGAADLMRPLLLDRDPRIVATASVALGASEHEDDVQQAESALTRIIADVRAAAAPARQEAVRAIALLGRMGKTRFRHLLLPLMYDSDTTVAREAVRGARDLTGQSAFVVPTLVSLLRHRRLKASAREVLVSYGEDVVEVLGYYLRDTEEDLWVRRHLPATLALIPCQKTMEVLAGALTDEDGFLRYKAVAALDQLHRSHPELTVDRERVEKLVLAEALRYFRYLGLHYNLCRQDGVDRDSLVARAMMEKTLRGRDRVFQLLGLLYPWKDVVSARQAMDQGEARLRASAVEYLDNLLSGPLRKRLLPLIEDLPLEQKVAKGNVLLKTRLRSREEALARLIYDDDPVVAACAIDLVREHKMWSLADDLEQVLAHRDPRDWHVFEAASWALAAYRLPQEKLRVV
jgi:AAA family ATP:ADP antiporter